MRLFGLRGHTSMLVQAWQEGVLGERGSNWRWPTLYCMPEHEGYTYEIRKSGRVGTNSFETRVASFLAAFQALEFRSNKARLLKSRRIGQSGEETLWSKQEGLSQPCGGQQGGFGARQWKFEKASLCYFSSVRKRLCFCLSINVGVPNA